MRRQHTEIVYEACARWHSYITEVRKKRDYEMARKYWEYCCGREDRSCLERAERMPPANSLSPILNSAPFSCIIYP